MPVEAYVTQCCTWRWEDVTTGPLEKMKGRSQEVAVEVGGQAPSPTSLIVLITRKGIPWDTKIIYLGIKIKLIWGSMKTNYEVGGNVFTFYKITQNPTIISKPTSDGSPSWGLVQSPNSCLLSAPNPHNTFYIRLGKKHILLCYNLIFSCLISSTNL